MLQSFFMDEAVEGCAFCMPTSQEHFVCRSYFDVAYGIHVLAISNSPLICMGRFGGAEIIKVHNVAVFNNPCLHTGTTSGAALVQEGEGKNHPG